MTSGRIKVITAAVVMAAPVAAWAAPAAAASPVGCGTTVQGSVTLHRDLHCHGDGVTVLSGTLNLNHHMISGDGTGSGVLVGGANTTIRNGHIAKFATGVTAIADNAGVTLSYLILSQMTGTAVDGLTINSIKLSHVTLRDNTGDALVVTAPNTASVSHSTISRNGRGIVLAADGAADVNDTLVESNGVGLYCSQGLVSVSRSAFVRNVTGVSVAECEGSVFTSSAFVENTSTGIAETEDYATPGQPTLTISHDIFFKNATGLALSAAGRADAISDNAFVANANGIVASCGFACDLVPSDRLASNYFASNTSDGANWGFGHVTVARNRFVNNGGWGFIAGADASVTNGGGNIAHGNHGGNCSGLTCAS